MSSCYVRGCLTQATYRINFNVNKHYVRPYKAGAIVESKSGRAELGLEILLCGPHADRFDWMQDPSSATERGWNYGLSGPEQLAGLPSGGPLVQIVRESKTEDEQLAEIARRDGAEADRDLAEGRTRSLT